jgi:hypothetical protein
MSALLPKADITENRHQVRLVPKRGIDPIIRPSRIPCARGADVGLRALAELIVELARQRDAGGNADLRARRYDRNTGRGLGRRW